MSGIAGEIAYNRMADPAAVVAMTEYLAPRGPDGQGVWSHDAIALGHRRLAVIDLSDAAAQPMHHLDHGLSIVLDGAIFNHHELREELAGRGHRFSTGSDIEVLSRGYLEWGDAVFERAQGIFACAIAERETGALTLVRDRVGIKPLYWAEVDGALRFASSLPALVRAGGVDTSIDTEALHSYMSFHAVVPSPRTILAGVRRISPATILRIEADGKRTERSYWEPSFARDEQHTDWSEADWQDAVLESLRTAVQRNLVADVPVGCLLSGGLDSSLIVGLLAEAGHSNLKTFSIGFEAAGGEEGDEFKYSDIVAEHFGTDHRQIRVDSARMLPALTNAIGAMSEPMVSHDAIAFYLLSQEVSQHVKVVQSGQGADEMFAGYHWYPPLAEVADDDVDGALATYRKAFFDRSHDELAGLLAPEWMAGRDVSGEFVREHFAAAGADTATDRALRLDTTVMAVDDPVKRVDNMTMAWGLEGRMPFLDHDLVQLAASCPPGLKTAHEGKGVLKEAARKVIPAAVIDRPKGYFPVPALKHLEGEYLDMVADALHSGAARDRGLFRDDAVERLLAAPNEQLTVLRGNQLWQIGLLELWLQQHVDGVGGVGR
ncbi:N-acetylglutaminylglutamine amidotransferase [Enemella sp. A6]|uniref:N-acetylglutaminylglutamine amidotransferase n=1 Tax=Enemella sp. A6 TaxID=3440152 RepID=UPI003EBA5C74